MNIYSCNVFVISNVLANISAHRTNRVPESGQPC